MKELYPEQEAALEAVLGCEGRPLVVIPTGGGKSLINAHLAANNLTGRTLCLTHVEELVSQNETELHDALEHGPWSIGVYCAALGRKETEQQIIVASVASVYRNPQVFKNVTLIVIDEAHRVSIFRGKMYQRVLEQFPGVPVIGLTATPFRVGTGLLHEGPEAFFDRIAYECTVRDLMGANRLVPLVQKSPHKVQLPTSDLKMRGGEYSEASLAEMAAEAPLTNAALRDALERIGGREHILVFSCNVDHAKMIKAYLRAHGESCDIVYGAMEGERSEILSAFKRGYIRWLINVNILTTGFNFPALDCIVCLRPTASTQLYVQMYGRGTRTALGKQDCLVLDYGGNIVRHGSFDDPRIGRANREPVYVCEKCETAYPRPHAKCPTCGNPTPRERALVPLIRKKGKESDRIEETITEFPVLSDGSQWMLIRSWTWRQHISKAGNPCIIVRYKIMDGRIVQEYLVEQQDAIERNYRWLNFMQRVFGDFPRVPCTVDEALTVFPYVRCPALILARKQPSNPEYWEVLKHMMEAEYQLKITGAASRSGINKGRT